MYSYYNMAHSILRSRTYTIANNLRLVIRNPIGFGRRAGGLLLRNPRKIARALLGTNKIQDIGEERKRLDEEYYKWITEVESKSFNHDEQVKLAKSLPKKPLISLITPVFNPPVEAHNKLIESVINQTYDNFQLLLFDFGTDESVSQLLDDWAEKDSRIMVKHNLPNEGIAKNSNLSLEYATGEYVGLLDHDDALMPNALYECAKVINDKDPDFIYSDKDKISEDDVRNEPLFKPDWSPEMALGGNYLTHFNLMRTEVVRKLDGWDPNTDGAQDWDLFLRILDSTDKVVHIPKILYHWRTVAGSTSTTVNVKPYALAGQRLAVNKHLKRCKIRAEAVQDDTSQTYIKWPIVKTPHMYLIHITYGDIGNAIKLAESIKSSVDFHPESRIVCFIENSKIDNIQKAKLEEIKSKANLLPYDTGEFARAVYKEFADSKSSVIYISDSNKKIESCLNDTTWISQLGGWLTIPGVNMSGGHSYANDGRIVDIGSFFDVPAKAFEKYYFSAGFRSGYNGYVQWIRNFIMPSERVFAFSSELINDSSWVRLTKRIRDDELCSSLALVSHSLGGRSVSDPSVRATDSAPFYYVLPPSEALDSYISKSCPDLSRGDKYYNPNLDRNYCDPKPITAIVDPRVNKYQLRTIDLPK